MNPRPPEPQSGALANCAIPTICADYVLICALAFFSKKKMPSKLQIVLAHPCKCKQAAYTADSLRKSLKSIFSENATHTIFFENRSVNVPEGIRTPDPRLRRPLLYPAELRTHKDYPNRQSKSG